MMSGGAVSLTVDNAFPVERLVRDGRPEPDADRPQEPAAGAADSLRSLFRAHRRAMLLTYGLFNLENLLRLAQPFVLGLAINGLLATPRWYGGLWLFVLQHMLHLALGTARRMYDTRTFTAAYTGMATKLVARQRASGIAVSRVAARSALSREFVEFFEHYVPLVIRSAWSILGALVMLAVYDWRLVPFLAGLMAPALLLNRRYAGRTLRLSRRLHNELEHEVDVIREGDDRRLRGHYQTVAAWRVRLSDAEAWNFSLMELFVLAVIVLSLLVVAADPAVRAGDIFAVFRYLMLFLTGLDAVPRLVGQVSRLRDIGRRVVPG